MRAGGAGFGAVDRRLIPEGRLTGPMPWVIAIMMFLTLLAAAAGLALGETARTLSHTNRITVQVVEGEAAGRERQARSAVALLERTPGVSNVARVSDAEMRRLLEPWLGRDGVDSGLPIPALIDADLAPEAAGRLPALRRALAQAAPSARVDDHAQALAPLGRLVGALRGLALLLVLLMVAATSATVVLAARASLDTHRGTVEVLHLMGATDRQVARLFQRRIALDALFGGVLGLLAAALVLWLIGERVRAIGSELVGSAALGETSWLLLALLPVGGVLLAMLVARAAILRALSRLL